MLNCGKTKEKKSRIFYRKRKVYGCVKKTMNQWAHYIHALFCLLSEYFDKKELSEMARKRLSEEEKKRKNREKQARWRKQNPEAARRIQERYWMKRIAKMQADDTTAV